MESVHIVHLMLGSVELPELNSGWMWIHQTVQMFNQIQCTMTPHSKFLHQFMIVVVWVLIRYIQ